MVDQHAVAAVGQIERDIFVGLLGAGAAVLVPVSTVWPLRTGR